MSDVGATSNSKASSWSDREKLVYLFGLMEASGKTLNYNDAPRRAGRTLAACKIMVHRLKNALKDDLEAMKAGQDINNNGNSTHETPKTSKRKSKAGDEDGSPKKRGRKKKCVEKAETATGNEVKKEEFDMDNETREELYLDDEI